jgi:hypothetical protein
MPDLRPVSGGVVAVEHKMPNLDLKTGAMLLLASA